MLSCWVVGGVARSRARQVQACWRLTVCDSVCFFSLFPCWLSSLCLCLVLTHSFQLSHFSLSPPHSPSFLRCNQVHQHYTVCICQLVNSLTLYRTPSLPPPSLFSLPHFTLSLLLTHPPQVLPGTSALSPPAAHPATYPG